MPIMIVSFEIYVDDQTYGDFMRTIIDTLGDHLIAIALDYRTPSSHSTPSLTLTVTDTPDARQAIATIWRMPDFDSFVDWHIADVTTS